MIKNIILDVGNVLAEWNPNKVYDNLDFNEDERKAISKATVESPAWNEFDRSALPDEEILALLIKNAPDYEKQIRLFFEHAWEAVKAYPYAKQWIKQMKQSGYKVYILSNYSSYTYAHTKSELEATTLADGCLFSFEVCQVKPDPDIYHTLLEKFGLKAEECVFLDDSEKNIVGARNCGINAIQFFNQKQAEIELKKMNVMI